MIRVTKGHTLLLNQSDAARSLCEAISSGKEKVGSLELLDALIFGKQLLGNAKEIGSTRVEVFMLSLIHI